jgi:hypothetical protein
MSSTVLPSGRVKHIHVNRQRIDANRKHGQNEPTITVKCGRRNYYGRTVDVQGDVRLSQEDGQLSCGARVYITTTGAVTVHP